MSRYLSLNKLDSTRGGKRISGTAMGNACTTVQRGATTFVPTSNEGDGAADAMERRIL